MGLASHLAFLKSSIIGGLRANNEVGSAARERPQKKSVDGMCIITSSTNHQPRPVVSPPSLHWCWKGRVLRPPFIGVERDECLALASSLLNRRTSPSLRPPFIGVERESFALL
jgi:hypothetical protein